MKKTAVQAWQSITREDTQRLVMSMRCRLQAVIACKGYVDQILEMITLFSIMFNCPIIFDGHKWGGGGGHTDGLWPMHKIT